MLKSQEQETEQKGNADLAILFGNNKIKIGGKQNQFSTGAVENKKV